MYVTNQKSMNLYSCIDEVFGDLDVIFWVKNKWVSPVCHVDFTARREKKSQ